MEGEDQDHVLSQLLGPSQVGPAASMEMEEEVCVPQLKR